MGTVRKLLASAALGLMLATPSWGGLLDFINCPVFEGYVSSAHINYFFLVSPDNKIVRILIKENNHMPDVLDGNKVRVQVSEGKDGQYYLEKLDHLDPMPNPQPVPITR